MDTAATRPVVTPTLTGSALRLRDEVAAGLVFFFGGDSCAIEPDDIDYDLIVVSARFSGVDRRNRENGLRELWYATGGEGPLDLICVTPRELEQAQRRATLIADVLPHAVDLLVPI